MWYKTISLYVLALFFVLAGANHFINPDFYLPLIPEYLPYHALINYVSGILEVILGVLIIPLNTRKYAAWGIMLLMVAFIPSHVFFITEGNCVASLCVPSWVGWTRLLIIHPLLILWAYWHRK